MTACLLCGETRWRSLLAIARPDDPTMQALDPSGRAEIVRCQSCGLLVTRPLPAPEQIGALYSSESYPCYYEARQGGELKRRLQRLVVSTMAQAPGGPVGWGARAMLFPILRRLGGVPQRRRSGRLLDIGCGDGAFVDALRGTRWQGVGLEMDPGAASAARAAGLTVEQGTLETMSFPNESFEAVRLWHVLEHVLNPLEVLRRVRRLLVPGGELILGLPNAASPHARFFGARWTAWDLPRHLYHFTPATLRQLLQQTGYVGIQIAHSSVGTGIASLSQPLSRQAWAKAANLLGDMVLDLCRCGDSLDVRAIRPAEA